MGPSRCHENKSGGLQAAITGEELSYFCGVGTSSCSITVDFHEQKVLFFLYDDSSF